jgi:hypothetical protein
MEVSTMKQTIILVLLLISVIAGLFYVGGTVLAIGLSAIALTALISLSFAMGARWAQHLINEGLAASARNTAATAQHEAAKVKATVELIREILRTAKTEQGQLHAPTGYPALPPISLPADEGSFRIVGLDETDSID